MLIIRVTPAPPKSLAIFLLIVCSSAVFIIPSPRRTTSSPVIDGVTDLFITSQRANSARADTTFRQKISRGSKQFLQEIAPQLAAARDVAPLVTTDQGQSSMYVEGSCASKIGSTYRRALGSQEMLMLPRQYAANPEVRFPQMNHVAVYTLSSTPSLDHLHKAVDEAIRVHPLLRAHVEGTGYPINYKDLMKMVRQGDPDPLTFVAPSVEEAGVRATDVVTAVDVPSANKAELEKSWKDRFVSDIDDPGIWCIPKKGPLWKMELHRLRGSNREDQNNQPSALVVTTNHAISDQGSLNVVVDQILSDLAEIEESESILHPAAAQPMPIALEDSVLGLGHRWSDIGARGMSLETFKYLAGKTWEIIKSPVLLPDKKGQREDGGGVLASAEIIAGMIPGGQDRNSCDRKTTLQFRTLSDKTTEKLLERCRAKRVAMSSALAAAVTITASDFINGGIRKNGKSRTYKVLQSLDMRRFGAKIDKGETISCQAGSMDLILGPVPDHRGEHLRSLSSADCASFWDIAKESFVQTSRFIKSKMPEEAVRIFDAGMSISEMNQLVHLEGKSKVSQGRGYSAGITNAGSYGRQKASARNNVEKQEFVKEKHGRYQILDVFYATSHARTGCLFPVSCLTVSGRIQCSFHPPSPLVSAETNRQFADAFIELLEVVANEKQHED